MEREKKEIKCFELLLVEELYTAILRKNTKDHIFKLVFEQLHFIFQLLKYFILAIEKTKNINIMCTKKKC